LLGAGVLINYFDRIGLSVAGPQLQREFALTPVGLGLLFSAFFWSYALMQIPASLLLDRLGVTRIGRWATFLWSAASTLTACAGGLGGLILARLLLGCAEGPSFPASAKATGYWFPRSERTRATALFDAAAKFSNVIGIPIVAIATVRLGWRYGFGLLAVLSFLYFLVFFRMYRDPSQHPRLEPNERVYLVAGGATPEGEMSGSSWHALASLLRRRKVWGLSLGFAAYGYCFYLFLTWLPAYLVTSFHQSLMKSASLAAIPWACATISDLLLGGWLVDRLITRGINATRVRKTVLLVGMCGGLAVFGATTTTHPAVAIAWIAIALSGLSAAAPVAWSLPSLIAPPSTVATVSGIMNFANNIMGIIAPLVTGLLVSDTHSFVSAFVVAGAVLAAGVFSYTFVLGPIEPISELASVSKRRDNVPT
jgi:MFS transporter, ACS family, D-galactonate transporter